jgi:hypothetical protein
MSQVVGDRGNNAFPQLSFGPLIAGATTQLFFLPLGLAEIQFYALDPNNPGILTLQDKSGNTILTLSDSINTRSSIFGASSSGTSASDYSFSGPSLPKFTGSLYFEVDALGKTYQINVSQATANILIYFEQPGET